MSEKTLVEYRLGLLIAEQVDLMPTDASDIEIASDALALLRRVPLHVEQILQGTHWERDRQAILGRAGKAPA